MPCTIDEIIIAVASTNPPVFIANFSVLYTIFSLIS